jgi:ATP-binding cassette subfamily B protein
MALDPLVEELRMVPPRWRAAVAPRIEPNEEILACFAPDLDNDLRFADQLIVLTTQRLLTLAPPVKPGADSRVAQSWPLESVSNLFCRERAGLGVLELSGSAGILAQWRYTAARATDVHQFTNVFDSWRRGVPLDIEEVEDDSSLTPPPNIRSLLRLFTFARKRMGLVLLGFALTLSATAAGLVPPYLTMPLLDDVLIPYQTEVDEIRTRPGLSWRTRLALMHEVHSERDERAVQVAWYLSGLAGAAIAAWILSWCQGYVMAWVSERISADLRNATYAHLHSLSLEFFGGKRTGDLMSRISNDTERICNFLSDNLVDFASDALMIIGTGLILASIDPLLAAATMLPFPLIGWLIYYLRGRLQSGFLRGGRAWGDMTSVLADTIPGIRVVKAFAQEKREIDRFRRSNQRVLDANDKVNTLWTFFWPLVGLLNQVGLLVVWAFGAWRVFEHQITVGELSAFLAYIGRFYTRLESMSRMFSATQRASASAQRVFEILDRVPSVAEPTNPVHPGHLQGQIHFHNVSFRYGNRQIIEDLNLEIRPGEMIGLVGPSGAGKSTLVNLVCRFYDVSQGAILVDGTDIRSFEVEEYRRFIGLVLQEPFLFYGSVAENIAYGQPNATRDEIVAAAKAARAHEFILRLPDGYDSMVGERGQSLSGGERQRISIARALLIDPRILILDEATSSVDTETEREIQAALDYLIQGRTTIAIAHRLSTLRKADRLIVMERGRIVEVGGHDELLEKSGVYARLHQAQMELSGQLDETAGVPAGGAS